MFWQRGAHGASHRLQDCISLASTCFSLRVVRFVRKGKTAGHDESVTYEYDAIGNLAFHSGVGEHHNGDDGRLPHAVVKAGNRPERELAAGLQP